MENNIVKGFKVFRPDWSCRPSGNFKQYTCPGRFEEDISPVRCGSGMHFCENLADCFNYYQFNPDNKVAEVIAYGEVVREGDKSCTNKLEIVRELTWDEVLHLANTGKNCTGRYNTGNRNAGDRNAGDCNTGDYNTGNCNTRNCNTGNYNTGDWNAGNCNTGGCNTGGCNTGGCNTGGYNTGDYNTGNYNTGNCNTGGCNTGDYNAGNRNAGDWNAGNRNTGNRNTGDWNAGDRNTGDWNKSSFNTGCFNTEEQKIMLFNKPSDWTRRDWLKSEARYLLNRIPKDVAEWVHKSDMTEEEKAEYPTYETTGGYLKVLDETECGQIWWNDLPESKRDIIRALPNFDAEIFFQCTGIKVSDCE